jgi:hypothetical protein
MNKTSIVILLISLLFTGCSPTKQQKKSVFSEDQRAELKGIFDRHLTDQDWDRYQQVWEKFGKKVNYDYDIDIRNDYDKDPMILMSIIEMSSDKPKLQQELTSYLNKTLFDKMREGRGIKQSDKRATGRIDAENTHPHR